MFFGFTRFKVKVYSELRLLWRLTIPLFLPMSYLEGYKYSNTVLL